MNVEKLEQNLIALLVYKREQADILSAPGASDACLIAAAAIRTFANELEEIMITNGVNVSF